MEDARRIRVESGKNEADALTVVLGTLNALYGFDARGRIASVSGSGGVPPRFVLGRAAEGCVWRFRSDLPEDLVARVARLAGREAGAIFEGELPAPPERLEAIGALLDASDPELEAGGSPGHAFRSAPARSLVTRDGVTLGELWSLD